MQALESVNLIRKKRSGKIKGQTCANGSRQRQFLKDGKSVASPTVTLESLISTWVIDAYEGRDVATFDVPGAYLHAEMPKEKRILMIIRGDFVDILCKACPKYVPYVKEIHGKKILYVRVLRAIYGCIESALLWYTLFSNTLKDMGFKINPYDRCIANKDIDGAQCTMAWYVDDVKISHRNSAVVSKLIEQIENLFGDVKAVRGNDHTYLGMNVSVGSDKQISISMKDQIQETLDAFPEDINSEVSSPAGRHLIQVNDNGVPLSKEKAELYHSIVAKLLYMEKRARPDIEPTVAFLCTRVQSPDEDDWKKLKRVLAFLKQTIDDKRIIGGDNLHSVFTWVDAAYAVHPNMCSHTRGAMSMGWGVLHSKSSKQKLNTKSSTEAELVGVSEYLPHNIWLMNFMEEQGYKVEHNVLYQDNESAIKMERNGRNSCTGNSRHISIRYFFVKDRVDEGEVDILYCPTHKMLADFFTKPLQGKQFKSFQDVIMGYKHIHSLNKISNEPTLKERIGEQEKRGNRNVTAVSYDEGVEAEKGSSQTYAEVVRGKDNNSRAIKRVKFISTH